MYRFVFWQNCLSPHQLPYIVHLLDDARVNEVVIVTNEVVSDERKNMGWDVTVFPGLQIVKSMNYYLNDKKRASISFLVYMVILLLLRPLI